MYDPSDFSTLFQDSAGTTAAVVGQPVGLLLDKSQGLVLGSEVAPAMSDIDITSSYGWTAVGTAYGSTVSVVSGALRVTKTQAIGQASIGQNGSVSSLPTVVGKSYKITLRTGAHTGAGNWDARFGLNNEGTQYCRLNGLSDNSSYTAFFTATTTTCFISLMSTGGAIGDYNDWVEVSVKELPGYHATQATSTARPILARHPITGRRNLLTYTEDFSNAVWVKTNVTIAGFALIETAATGEHLARQTASVTASIGARITFTVDFKRDIGSRNIGLRVAGSSGSAYAVFNTATGALVTTATSGSNWTVESATPGVAVSGGYLRASVTVVANEAGSVVAYVQMVNGTAISYVGDGISSVVANNSHLELGSTPTAYQKVVSTYDVTEAGVNDAYHLKFDGVDDFLVTPSINFSGTDKMSVFAGVRKLSDAAAGMILELSASAAVNNGSFYIDGPETGATYGVRTRGTVAVGGYNHATFTAPITNVISANLNNAGALVANQVATRFNGVLNTIGSSGATTAGNFGNHPLYIGCRGGALNPFNGHLYSLVVRGALSDAAQIAAAEAFVNSKTGAY